MKYREIVYGLRFYRQKGDSLGKYKTGWKMTIVETRPDES